MKKIVLVLLLCLVLTALCACSSGAAPAASSSGSSAEADDGQNPVMNFIGNYVCDRANILIETDGKYCRGMTVCDLREDRDRSRDRMLVLTDVNREHFIRFFLDSLNQLDKTRIYQ